MYELIQVSHRLIGQDSVPSINARDLYVFIESKRQFADWIKERINHYEFTEGLDFTVHKFVNGRSNQTDYYLTIDMAKELAMVERNEKGKQARQYFIECERRLRAIPETPSPVLPDFTNPALAARAWAEQYDGRCAADRQAAASVEKLATIALYADILDRLSSLLRGNEATKPEQAAMTGRAPKQYSSQITLHRKRLGMDEHQFSRAIGVSRTAVMLWEGGKCEPTATHRRKIQELLGIKLQFE